MKKSSGSPKIFIPSLCYDRNWNISLKTVLRLEKFRLFFQNGFESIVKIVWTMKRFLLQHMSNMTVENCRTCSSVSHFVRLSSLSTNMYLLDYFISLSLKLGISNEIIIYIVIFY